MKGVIEAISKERYGIKVENVWYNARKAEIKAFFKDLEKGDTIEFQADEKRNLTFIKKVEEPKEEVQKELGKDFKTGDKVKSGIDHDAIMQDTLEKCSQMAQDPNIKFPAEFDWTKIVITLFISKSRGQLK